MRMMSFTGAVPDSGRTTLQEEEKDGNTEQREDAHRAHGLRADDGRGHQLNQQVSGDPLGDGKQVTKEAEQIGLKADGQVVQLQMVLDRHDFCGVRNRDTALAQRVLQTEFQSHSFGLVHREKYVYSESTLLEPKQIEQPDKTIAAVDLGDRLNAGMLEEESIMFFELGVSARPHPVKQVGVGGLDQRMNEDISKSVECSGKCGEHNPNEEHNCYQFDRSESSSDGSATQFTGDSVADGEREIRCECGRDSLGGHQLHSCQIHAVERAESAVLPVDLPLAGVFVRTRLMLGPLYVISRDNESTESAEYVRRHKRTSRGQRRRQFSDISYTDMVFGTTIEEVVRLACALGGNKRAMVRRVEAEHRHEHLSQCRAEGGLSCDIKGDLVVVRAQWQRRRDANSHGSSFPKAHGAKIMYAGKEGRVAVGVTSSLALLYSAIADTLASLPSKPLVIDGVRQALGAIETWRRTREASSFLREDGEHVLRSVRLQADMECVMLRRAMIALEDEQLVRRMETLDPAHAMRVQVATLRGAAWPTISSGGIHSPHASPIRASKYRAPSPIDEVTAVAEGVRAGLAFAATHAPLATSGIGFLHRGNLFPREVDDELSITSGSTGVSTGVSVSGTSVVSDESDRSNASSISWASANSYASTDSVYSARSVLSTCSISSERSSTMTEFNGHRLYNTEYALEQPPSKRPRSPYGNGQ